MKTPKRRLKMGEALVEAGVLKTSSLEKALEIQKRSHKRLGLILEEMGEICEEDIALVLAAQFGVPHETDLAQGSYAASLLKLVDSQTAVENLVFPIRRHGHRLYLAMVNPLDLKIVDQLAFRTELQIIPCVATSSEILQAIRLHYLKKEGFSEPDWWTTLVVDHQDTTRTATVLALQQAGYRTLEATSVSEGLKMVLRHTPHLIVLETNLPRLSGKEMLRILQTNQATRKIPVFALSANADSETEAHLLELGFFDFLAKPCNPNVLVARCRRALRHIYGDTFPMGQDNAAWVSSLINKDEKSNTCAPTACPAFKSVMEFIDALGNQKAS